MPLTDVVRLLDMVVFNVLVCNTDAHAKNYSILIRGNGASLAPMFDVMCGEVWENVTRNLAQRIGGESWGDYLKGRHWRLFARECSLNPKQVLDRVSTLAKLTAAETRAAESEVAAMPAGPHPIHSQTRQAVERRAQVLLAQLHEAGDEPDIERVEDCIPASAGEKSGGVSRDISRGSETFAIDRTIA